MSKNVKIDILAKKMTVSSSSFLCFNNEFTLSDVMKQIKQFKRHPKIKY